MGPEKGLTTARLLDSKRIMATGTQPDQIKGIIKYFLSMKRGEELNTDEFDVYTKKGDEILL